MHGSPVCALLAPCHPGVDARANRVIWRGWAQESIEDELDDPDQMEATIEEAVTQILARFPRSL